MQIDTVYRLYFLEQLFEKRPNQAVFFGQKGAQWCSDKESNEVSSKIRTSKKIILPSKMQIETVYRLYFLEQLFEKMPIEAVFSDKKVQNGALMKNRAKYHQKIVPRKKHFWHQKCISRQCIDCTFWSNLLKKGQIKYFFLPKLCTMVLW